MSVDILRVFEINKNFRGVKAIKGVSFKIRKGEILGLIGPNGAGKTTIINLITGFLKPDTGHIYFQDKEITNLHPYQIARLGIARTFQHVQVFGNLTVLENVLLGFSRHIRRHFLEDLFNFKNARIEEKAFEAKAKEILDNLLLRDFAYLPARFLPYGEQRRVVLARALASDPELLLLDEPAAGLSPKEGKDLIKLLKQIKKDGLSVLIVDHDVELILGVCDRVLVLSSGELIAEGLPSEIRKNRRVIEAYLGDENVC